MKKFFYVSLILWLVLIASMVYSLVQQKTITSSQYKFRLSAGQKIYIFKADANVRVYCTPKEAKEFYYKVPEKKTLSGVLVLK